MSWEIVCAISLGIVLLVTIISIFGLFGLESIRTVSDKIDVWVNAIPLTFSIWGIILGFQIASITLSFVYPDKWFGIIGPWYVLLSIFYVLWLVSFGLGFPKVSYFMVIAMTTCLAGIYSQLQIYYFSAGFIKTWGYNVPFSLYLGWCTAAWMLNFFAVREGSERNTQIGETFFMVLPVLCVPVVILLFYFNDVVFTIAIVWGLIGIFANSTGSDEPERKKIASGALIGIVSIGIFTLFILLFQIF